MYSLDLHQRSINLNWHSPNIIRQICLFLRVKNEPLEKNHEIILFLRTKNTRIPTNKVKHIFENYLLNWNCEVKKHWRRSKGTGSLYSWIRRIKVFKLFWFHKSLKLFNIIPIKMLNDYPISMSHPWAHKHGLAIPNEKA